MKAGRILIKRIYEPPSDGDGRRLLVDRIWPRGIRREGARLDGWLKDIAPSADLRKWFAHDPARFAGFRERYRQELDRNAEAVGKLRSMAGAGRVTLLYAAKDELHNNAVVLAAYLQE